MRRARQPERMAALDRRAARACFILFLAGPGGARAGGILLYETGTPDMFTAGAGWAARAQDVATVLTNPAGMTRIKSWARRQLDRSKGCPDP